MSDFSPSGLPHLPELRWGSHVSHFFESGRDLGETVVPYFKAGLENNERCLWVTGSAFNADAARSALRNAVPDLDIRERRGQIEIANGDEWYSSGQKLQPRDLVDGLLMREQDALDHGFRGLRTNGNCSWVSPAQWPDFMAYEKLVQTTVGGRRMICMCSYCRGPLDDGAAQEVIDRHDMIVPGLRAHAVARPAAPPLRAVDGGVRIASLPAMPEIGTGSPLLDAMPVGVAVCDRTGRMVYANPRATDLWGQHPQASRPDGRYCGSFRLETPDGREIAREETPMAKAARFGESTIGGEAVVVNPDGRRWVMRADVAPLRAADGEVTGALGCFRDVTEEYRLREEADRQRHRFDLAMLASNMGTWRYTLADNVCLYDANAQRLYGLSEGRFVHDADGVKERFHPDDLEGMWTKVQIALDPAGDGRYDAEYRVKQPDGSWRWVSAWGLAEFEGSGSERKAVAITGASRDLTERKEVERLQSLLVHELNHRMRNTLATIQSLVEQTLRTAKDLPAAREAVHQRIAAMARAHDLLISRNWSDTDLERVVARALEAFPPAQVTFGGEALQVSSQQTLALSLALHELATNATKYGALSVPEGRVSVRWWREDRLLHLDWQETDGPPVRPPSRTGFGSRLIEALTQQFKGRTLLSYPPSGVTCRITTEI
jgi:PAS domain S-box-containing protein